MITIVYPYRNREIKRLQRSIDSLFQQSNQNFKLCVIDYGSDQKSNEEIKSIIQKFDFGTYEYLYTEGQPWSKSKALNYGLRQLVTTPYFFVADVDIIFSPNFVARLHELVLKGNKINTYFKVGFLSKEESAFTKEFKSYNVQFESNKEATGLTMFHTESLKSICGFDEFYHFWGAEDTDAHVRLQNAGFEVFFYDTEILMLHQWHHSYRSTERKQLTVDLQLTGVVVMNHQHLKTAIFEKRTKVNFEGWGTTINQQQYELLQNPVNRIIINNQKAVVDHFLYFTLKQSRIEITEFVFQLDSEYLSGKQTVKKIFRKKTPVYYTLKQINDLLLLHIISSPKIKSYKFQIASDLKSISLSI